MKKELLYSECFFKAVRSSGPGGQHVNKTSSKIELYFNVEKSNTLKEDEKEKIKVKLTHRITQDGVLIITCQDTRSQHKNKELAFKKFLNILNTCLARVKRRIPSKVPKSVKIKRLKNKRINADRKMNRRKPDLD